MAANFAPSTIWTGDNLAVLRGMNDACGDLIYLDPPFNSNRNYEAPIGSKAAGASFKDAWTLDDVDVCEHGELADRKPAAYAVIEAARLAHGKGMQSYLIFMAVRLLEMHRILKQTGSIYLHCDPTASHYLKLLMDGIFGWKNFVNEIAWCYKSGGASPKRYFSKKHDIILLYSRSQNYLYNKQEEKSYNRGCKPYKFKGNLEKRRYEGSRRKSWYRDRRVKRAWNSRGPHDASRCLLRHLHPFDTIPPRHRRAPSLSQRPGRLSSNDNPTIATTPSDHYTCTNSYLC